MLTPKCILKPFNISFETRSLNKDILSLIFENLSYSNKYEISADYEFIIKLFSKKINSKYINLNILVMRLGGISTSIKTLLEKRITR